MMPELTDRPNIVLITTDQQRFDTFGRFKPPFLRTVHLDHLAAEGVTFTNAYADCPLCVPARMSIMSGKYAVHHRMTYNGPSSQVLGRTETLPAYLRGLGYQTAAIGKMHFGPMRTRHGFDEMILPDDYYREMRRRGYELQPMRHGLGQNELTPSLATVPEPLTLTSWTVEKCREYIQERRDPTVPFFLWCSFAKPHPPFDPPEPYYSMYRDAAIPPAVRGDWNEPGRVPEAFARQRDNYCCHLYQGELLRAARAAYYGMITHIDHAIGRLMGALLEVTEAAHQGLTDALVLFTSDHGEYLGDHGSISKSFLHEVSAHVPFIVKPPRSWDTPLYGRECPHLVTHADIVATCLRAAGGEAPAGSDGVDLLALARGEAAPRKYLDAISGGPADGNRSSVGITDGRWKYLWFPEGGVEQLFDLETDRYETRDLAASADHRAKRNELRAALAARHRGLPYGYVRDGDLVTMPLIDDKRDGRRQIHRWAPGYATEYSDSDTHH